MFGSKVQPILAHRISGPDVQILDRLEVVRTVNRHCRNNFRCCPDDHALVVAVEGCGNEQVTMFWPDSLGVTMRDRREQ